MYRFPPRLRNVTNSLSLIHTYLHTHAPLLLLSDATVGPTRRQECHDFGASRRRRLPQCGLCTGTCLGCCPRPSRGCRLQRPLATHPPLRLSTLYPFIPHIYLYVYRLHPYTPTRSPKLSCEPPNPLPKSSAAPSLASSCREMANLKSTLRPLCAGCAKSGP